MGTTASTTAAGWVQSPWGGGVVELKLKLVAAIRAPHSWTCNQHSIIVPLLGYGENTKYFSSNLNT